jgi:hypothetical protein
LLSKNMKKLPKPFSPYGAGGLAVAPERVVQIRDAKGTNHSQILLLPGLIVYAGEYATTNKDVIARFLKALPSAKSPASPSRRKKNG